MRSRLIYVHLYLYLLPGETALPKETSAVLPKETSAVLPKETSAVSPDTNTSADIPNKEEEITSKF